jgi:hemerythrin
MRQPKWNSTYLVHIPDIDSEHREMHKLAGRLHRAIIGGSEAKSIDALLTELLDGTMLHLEHEESLMREAEYPSLEWHTRQHDAARKKLSGLARRIRKGDAEARLELLDYITGWLKDHITVADKMMGAYLRNRRRLWSAIAS